MVHQARVHAAHHDGARPGLTRRYPHGTRFIDTPGDGGGDGDGGGGDGDDPDDKGDGGDPDDAVYKDPSRAKDEVRKARKEAATYREKAKAREEELEKLRGQSQTDAERAVEEAEARGEKRAAVKTGQRLARSEIKAALIAAGADDPDDIMDDLDLGRFVDEDGEVDDDAVDALRVKWEKRLTPRKRGGGDVGAARKGGGANPKRSTADSFADWIEGE